MQLVDIAHVIHRSSAQRVVRVDPRSGQCRDFGGLGQPASIEGLRRHRYELELRARDLARRLAGRARLWMQSLCPTRGPCRACRFVVLQLSLSVRAAATALLVGMNHGAARSCGGRRSRVLGRKGVRQKKGQATFARNDGAVVWGRKGSKGQSLVEVCVSSTTPGLSVSRAGTRLSPSPPRCQHSRLIG
jgi:hypothetical protein